MPHSGPALLVAALLAATTAGQQDAGRDPATGQGAASTLFTNLNRTFHLDLPVGWRQIAPNEALRVAEHAAAPRDLCRAEPRNQYAVGPVDRWLAGDFAGPWLFVTEIAEEAVVPENFAEPLAEMWRRHGVANGITHELEGVQQGQIGPANHPVIMAKRNSRPADGRRPVASLDVHVATGKQQVTLSFTAWNDEFDAWEPGFRRWLQTATFARPPRPPQKLSDRLWTPLLTGAAVSLVLFLLYKHQKRKR